MDNEEDKSPPKRRHITVSSDIWQQLFDLSKEISQEGHRVHMKTIADRAIEIGIRSMKRTKEV